MKLKKMTAFVLALAVLMTSFNLWDVKADTTDGSNHYMEEEEAYNESVINEYDNNEYSDIEPVISPDGSGSYNNPVVISDDTMQYDCVWFGNYWQNDTNGDGVADTGDEKEPIKWRVLQNREEELFLLSDKIIDVKAFYEDLHPRDERWARSTIRSWLNGYGSDSNDCNLNYSGNGFIDNAFRLMNSLR